MARVITGGKQLNTLVSDEGYLVTVAELVTMVKGGHR